jgi:hypothetical protein
MAVHSLSRLRGRVGVGVPARDAGARGENSPPDALGAAERVDLPRKRER